MPHSMVVYTERATFHLKCW